MRSEWKIQSMAGDFGKVLMVSHPYITMSVRQWRGFFNDNLC